MSSYLFNVTKMKKWENLIYFLSIIIKEIDIYHTLFVKKKLHLIEKLIDF